MKASVCGFLMLTLALVSCQEGKNSQAETPIAQQQPVKDEPAPPQKVYTAEERAANFLRGTWVGSNNGDFYVFTGSKLLKKNDSGRVLVSTGYKVFFATETEYRFRFADGSKGSVLRLGDDLLVGRETLKKVSDSVQ